MEFIVLKNEIMQEEALTLFAFYHLHTNTTHEK